jgi:hypothetical protein
MRTITAAAIMIAMLAAPAHAQKKDAGAPQEGTLTPMQMIEQGKRQERLDADRQYEKRAKIPEASTTYDPWRGVRPSTGEKR